MALKLSWKCVSLLVIALLSVHSVWVSLRKQSATDTSGSVRSLSWIMRDYLAHVGAPLTPGPLFLNASVSIYDVSGLSPRNPAACCEMFFLVSDMCRVASREENMFDCIERHGVEVWNLAIQPACTTSIFWRTVLQWGRGLQQPAFEDSASAELFFDPVMRQHMLQLHKPVNITPVAARSLAVFHPSLNCSIANSTFKIHPVGFCIPQAVMPAAPVLSKHKIWDWYPVLSAYIPYHRTKKIVKTLGPRERWGLGAADELAVLVYYRFSRFAWTHARAGVDCLRHYEVLGSGAIPLFPDLWEIPPFRVSHLPRSLLLEAMNIPGVAHHGRTAPISWGRLMTEYYFRLPKSNQFNFRKVGTINHTQFRHDVYDEMAAKLFAFSKEHVVCSAVVASILRGIAMEEPNHVYLFGLADVDYMAFSVEEGLMELGIPYTVMGASQHRQANVPQGGGGAAYDAWRKKEKLDDMYGRGFFVSRRIPPPSTAPSAPSVASSNSSSSSLGLLFNCEWAEAAVRADDVVIFSWFELLPCQRQASNMHKKGARVVIVDGDDTPMLKQYPLWTSLGFHVFSREAWC